VQVRAVAGRDRRDVADSHVRPVRRRHAKAFALAGYDDEFHERADLSSLEAVFSAGEPLNPPAWEWLQREVLDGEVPVIDHMWQTETGGPIIGNPYGISTLPIKPGSAGVALPGIQVDVVDFDGDPIEAGEEGALVIERPFPGMTPTLWEGHDRYEREYWQRVEGKYWVGDAVSKDEDGYDGDNALREELREAVRRDVGPIAVVGELAFVDQLPKTRSGKIMRRTIRDILLDEDLGDVSTLEDESAVDEIESAVAGIEVNE